MKEITLNIDGKEIKAMVSKEEIEKLTTQEPSVRLGFAGSILKKARENERAKKEWPQFGDTYWWIDVTGEISPKAYADYEVDKEIQLLGNMYRTKQEALDAVRAQKLIAAIAKRRKELNGDWKLDWNGPERVLYFIYFYRGGLTPNWYMDANLGSPFGNFKSVEVAQTIIDEFRDELEWYFTEYTVSVN